MILRILLRLPIDPILVGRSMVKIKSILCRYFYVYGFKLSSKRIASWVLYCTNTIMSRYHCIRGGPLGPMISFFASPGKTRKDFSALFC